MITGTWFHDHYSFSDVDNFARTAAASSRFMMIGADMTLRYDIAFSAIVEELHLSKEAPEPRRLVHVGMSEISREVYCVRRNAGRDPSGRLEWAPMFWKYWESLPRGGPEQSVVDRVALHQIWSRLKPGDRRLLEAVSIHDSHAAAAETLGMTSVQFANRLRRARATFFALWHEGEKPSTIWRKTLRGKRQEVCRRGHELTGANVAWTGKPGRRTRTCKTCLAASRARYRERQRARGERSDAQ